MTNYTNTQYLHSQLTEQIIKAYYHVFNALGYGFAEKVYENAMLKTLQKWGYPTVSQKNIRVFFEGEEVGDYFADLIVDGKVIVELKAHESLREEHETQLQNYLKATNIEIGLLLNFGKTPQLKRKIFTNDKKPHLTLG